MDEFDGANAFLPYGSDEEMAQHYKRHPVKKEFFDWYFMYFKRSYVMRKQGQFLYYPHIDRPDFYAITYSLAEVIKFFCHLYLNHEPS